MKHQLLPLLMSVGMIGCSSPCDNEEALAKYAQEGASKMFPVPASVSYTLDSVYSHNGNQIVRGRVSYTNANGEGKGPVKYWIGMNCSSGDPVMKFLDVDWGGPKWQAPE